MPTTKFDKESIKKSIVGKVQRYNGLTIEEATKQQVYRAVASTVRDQIMQKYMVSREERKKSKKKRSDFCRDIGTIIVKPFLYANEGGGILPRCGKTPQRLYPQLGFSVPSYNFEPAEHIEYMLQEINRREGLVND